MLSVANLFRQNPVLSLFKSEKIKLLLRNEWNFFSEKRTIGLTRELFSGKNYSLKNIFKGLKVF